MGTYRVEKIVTMAVRWRVPWKTGFQGWCGGRIDRKTYVAIGLNLFSLRRVPGGMFLTYFLGEFWDFTKFDKESWVCTRPKVEQDF